MIHGIRDRGTFSQLRAEGHQVKSRDLRLRFVRGEESSDLRIAWAISRKVGNAVVRNRIRRQLKAATTDLFRSGRCTSVDAGLVIVFPSAINRSFDELREQMDQLLLRAEDVTV